MTLDMGALPDGSVLLFSIDRHQVIDMILGVEDILISWFIILALLGVASLFVCCMIHCKHLRLSDANKLSYLLTYIFYQR